MNSICKEAPIAPGAERGTGKVVGAGVNVVVVQKYREELLLASRCQLWQWRGQNSCGLPTLTTLTLFIPLASSSLPSPQHQRESVAWPGWAGRLAGAAALRAIYSLILYEHLTVKLEIHRLCSFLSVLSSSIQLSHSLTHTYIPLVPLSLSLTDHGSTDCVTATCWHCWPCMLKDRCAGKKTCRGKFCPEAFSDLHYGVLVSEWLCDSTCPLGLPRTSFQKGKSAVQSYTWI